MMSVEGEGTVRVKRENASVEGEGEEPGARGGRVWCPGWDTLPVWCGEGLHQQLQWRCLKA